MTSSDGEVLNVLFHGIGTPERELEPGEDTYWIDADTFHRILDDVVAASAAGDLPALRLSFDDSNTSDITVGLPALLERGLTADFFVLAGRLRSPGSLDADAVRELRRQGMNIGTHGMHHHPWRGLDADRRRDEFVTARETIAEVIGAPVTQAACPLGRYDRQTLSELRRLGYAEVFTSDRRYARRGRWLQPRYSVRRGDTAASFRAQIAASRTPAMRTRNALAGTVKRLR
ncbi:polysaccharide deacetylase family protein [Dactylosporangium sp. CA-052675]|uniref:polysaccharide deacetylase family protein n=1 Tax=Dactylosporangium sp. CA-052675 TaxID=3239927 RepID=UPI003D9081B0